MFHYKNIIQNEVDPSIYNRGVRLFLEGGVISSHEMVLDYWKSFSVFDTYTKNTYTVITPLLHLAVDSKKWDKVGELIHTYATCTCPYFTEGNGICKHIVAVYTSLEHELIPKQTKSHSLTTSVFDSFEEADNHKTYKQWIIDFELWLQNPKWHGRSKFLASINTQEKLHGVDSTLFTSFFKEINDIVRKHITIWENEKSIQHIIISTLTSNSKVWKTFWQSIIPNIHVTNTYKLWASLFSLSFDQQIARIYPKYITFALNLYSTKELHSIQTYIIQSQRLTFERKVSLFFDFQEYDALYELRKDLDPQSLLLLCKKHPEYLEECQQFISAQLTQWLEFAKHDNYHEIEAVLRSWKEVGGGISFAMQEFILFCKTEYKKRRSLMKILTTIESKK